MARIQVVVVSLFFLVLMCVGILALENLETWEPYYAQRGALGNEYFSLKSTEFLIVLVYSDNN